MAPRRGHPKRTGSHALVESLTANGVSTLFGIPGVDTLGVYDAFLDTPGIRPINVRHEQSAVFMADGYARSGGGIGVALTSGGPGALNTVTAMATAHNDSVAVLQVLNENPAHVRRKSRGYFHDLSDQLGIFRPVTDFTAQVSLASEIPAAIGSAMSALRNRRPRPAMVEIAGEAFAEPWEASRRSSLTVAQRTPAARLYAGRQIGRRCCERRSAPCFGSAEEWSLLTRRRSCWTLAERLGAPVLTAQAGKGAFPADHELHVGNWANEKPVRDLIADPT